MTEALLNIKDLNVVYQSKQNITGKTSFIYAVNGVSFAINKGEIFAIAGESGCGKSTLSKALMRLIPVKSGEIFFSNKNILELTQKEELKNYRKNVQMIFQNPYASLNPKMKIKDILSEPLQINTNLNRKEIENTIKEKIKQVGLDENILELYPHEFSGGQRQRIAIARALVLNPEFIIADEPVSALDVSIQAQIINLLKDLKENFNLTLLFISHDLRVIRYLSDRIAIMYLGEIVETGNTIEIFSNPKHPYTQMLLNSIPEFSNTNKDKLKLTNFELPNPENLPKGCKFYSRCPHSMTICEQNQPPCIEFSKTHICNCFLYNNDNLETM